MRLIALLLLLGGLANRALATHIRAGDISMFRVQTADPSVLTYRVVVNLYRDGGSAIEFEGTLDFGDGASSLVRATKIADIAPQIEHWRVEAEHTFPSDGVYSVGYFEQNRNDGIRNMNNSVNTPFYIESIFFIDQSLGANDSPILNIPPIDEATVGQRFIHNPGAFDFQGDSLSYRITVCKRAKGTEVDNYRFPDVPPFSSAKEDGTAPAAFSINAITGDLIWDAPGLPGEYNVAFFVDEWRDGVRIGTVNRDMQIIVRNHQNRRPNVELPFDTCIVAGNLLQALIAGTDPDGDRVVLTRQPGGIFELNAPSVPAAFDVLGIQPPNGREEGIFSWQTTCFDVADQPYQVTFKAEDDRAPTVRLADLQSWRIKVVGPAPLGLVAVPDQVNATIALSWNGYACGNAEKMMVWRRRGSLSLPLDTCITGVQGYELIGEVPIGTTSFVDSGLERGYNYCYRIHAAYPQPKGGESLRSEEACAFIESLAPYMLNVSIQSPEGSSETDGRMLLRWSTANADPANFPPPITYQLERAPAGGSFAVVGTNLTDTVFAFDEALNTQGLVYQYRVKAFSQGNLIDSSAVASSVRLEAVPRPAAIELEWSASVPWNNFDARFPFHYIYREYPTGSGTFELIDSVNVLQQGMRYTDRGDFRGEGLSEVDTYCYYVETVGSYDGHVKVDEPLRNLSQVACAIVQDSVPPCPPVLALQPIDCGPLQQPLPDQTASCDIAYANQLSWVLGTGTDCDNSDVVGYRLYYSPHGAEELALLEDGLTDLSYVHDRLASVAGCYAVTAVDDFGNESAFSNVVCQEANCPYYELPNVFTPNGDGLNDTFRPFRCPRFVQQVTFTAYNRWGVKVFERNDNVDIAWDGTSNGGQPLPTGAYYYVAEVVFFNLSPDGERVVLKGIAHLMRDE
jgi:gliding motility-associated-like protein